MKNLLSFILIFVFLTGNAATTVNSVADGAWSDDASWDDTAPANNTTTSNETINILHNITLTDDLTVGANTTINIASGDTLHVIGDVTFANNSVINLAAGGVLLIDGNVTNNNNSDEIVIDGTIIINGNFDGGNGSEINGVGAMDITGTVTTDNTGSVFGSTLDCSSNCSSSASSPLPVTLVEFSAIANEDQVEIFWSTASEANCAYFVIEKSKDGYNWEVVSETEGAGNSSTLIEYYEFDGNPYQGLSYYRLTQVDFDGKYEMFNSVPVEFISAETEVFSIFPNPVDNIPVNVQLKNFKGKEVLLVLRNVVGQSFYSEVTIIESEDEIVILPVNELSLPSGAYLVTASSENSFYSQTVIVR